jgi:hypothetical protein
MISTTAKQAVQTMNSRGRRVALLTASISQAVPRSLRLAVGPFVGSLALVGSAAAQSSMKDAICQTGAGDLLSMGIGLLALVLVYYSIYDFYGGFKAGQGGDAKKRAQAGSYYRAGGKKLVGAVFIAGSPDFFSALGFTLLDCVSVAQIFA